MLGKRPERIKKPAFSGRALYSLELCVRNSSQDAKFLWQRRFQRFSRVELVGGIPAARMRRRCFRDAPTRLHRVKNPSNGLASCFALFSGFAAPDGEVNDLH